MKNLKNYIPAYLGLSGLNLNEIWWLGIAVASFVAWTRLLNVGPG